MRTVTGSIRVMLVALLATFLFVGVWFLFREQDNGSPVSQNSHGTNERISENGPMIGGAETESSKTIRENLVQSKDHTTFVVLMQTTSLASLLNEGGPVTIFAPTNIAFGKYPSGAFQALVKPENKSMLEELFKYHVVPGEYRTSNFKEGMKLKTIQGEELTLTQKDGQWWINGTTKIETADIASNNGVVHSIDSVLASSAQ